MIDAESIALELKKKLADPVNGVAVAITNINTIKAQGDPNMGVDTDLVNYGQTIICDIPQPEFWYFEIVNESVVNSNSWLCISEEGFELDGLGGGVSVTLKMKVAIGFTDAGDFTTPPKTWRYRSALRQVFEEFRFIYGLGSDTARIKDLKSEPLTDKRGSSWREVGILLEMSFAAY
jgi:hypothetical protein